MLGGQAFWASGQRWDWNLGQRSNPDPPELVAEMFGKAPATTYLSETGMGRSVLVDLGPGVRIGGRRNGPGLCVRKGRSAYEPHANFPLSLADLIKYSGTKMADLTVV